MRRIKCYVPEAGSFTDDDPTSRPAPADFNRDVTVMSTVL